MGPDVLFESSYTYDPPYASCVSGLPILLLFLFVAVKAALVVPLLLSLPLWCWLVYKNNANAVKEHENKRIQITQQDIRIVRINGPVVRAFPFKDIIGIYAQDDSTLSVQVRSFTDPSGYESHQLIGVGQAKRFAAIAQAQAKAVQKGAAASRYPAIPQVPAYAFQPAKRTVSESASDTLHAADQLRMTGQITQGQYDVMTGKAEPQQMQPPVPQQDSGAVDLQNAEDFLRRNEMIAQQMRAEQMQQSHSEQREDDTNGGTGFISGEG